jgi:hypothetical protein
MVQIPFFHLSHQRVVAVAAPMEIRQAIVAVLVAVIVLLLVAVQGQQIKDSLEMAELEMLVLVAEVLEKPVELMELDLEEMVFLHQLLVRQ